MKFIYINRFYEPPNNNNSNNNNNNYTTKQKTKQIQKQKQNKTKNDSSTSTFVILHSEIEWAFFPENSLSPFFSQTESSTLYSTRACNEF